MPPLRGLDHVRDSCRGGAPLGLDLTDLHKATSGESLLELTRDDVIRVVVRSERGEEGLPELVPSLLGGSDSGGRGGVIQVVDIKINDANLRRWANGVLSLGRETNDVGTRIIDVNLCVSSVNGGKNDTIPTAEFNNIF